MTAVAQFPRSLDNERLERVRRPLAAIAALLLVIDLIGLGLHLADGATSPFASEVPSSARTRVDGPEAVVPGTVRGPQANRVERTRAAEPFGCLAAGSACYVAPTSPTSPGNGSPAPATPPPGGAQPVPVVQSNVGVPAVGTQVSVGLGEGSCTGIDLTVLAIGECPTASSDGPVVLELGGSLVGD